jgi:Fe-S-cluster containining protein
MTSLASPPSSNRACGFNGNVMVMGDPFTMVQKDEIERIADFLGIDSASFVSRFCDEKNGRFSIKSGKDQHCIFFDKEKQCLIHPVKPLPCALWPFYPALLKDPDNWESAKDACPGINPDCSFDDFVKQAKEEASKHQES